jgi:2'-5' RNA ligase
VDGSERLRLFCAFQLPSTVVSRLAEWQSHELRGERHVSAENLHVTLVFLGSRPAADVPAVEEALACAVLAAGPPRLRLRAYRETRSVGMLVFDDEEGRAAAVAEALAERLGELGLARREKRPWLPHVTVLRFRTPPRLHPGLPELGAVCPSDAAVFISRLRPDGAQYEVLRHIPLGGR